MATDEGNPDMALSDQLSQLAARAQELEDHAAAAHQKAKADLQRTSRGPAIQRRPRPSRCARARRHVRVSSRPGGTTCSVRGTRTSPRSAMQSTTARPSTTSKPRSARPTRPTTTPLSQSTTRTRRSKRPSTRCSTPNSHTWRPTTSPTQTPRAEFDLSARTVRERSHRSRTVRFPTSPDFGCGIQRRGPSRRAGSETYS